MTLRGEQSSKDVVEGAHLGMGDRPGTAPRDRTAPARGGGATGAPERPSRFGLLAGLAVVACCGVQLLLLAALGLSLGSRGVVVRNVALGVAGLVVAAAVVAYAVRRRRCDLAWPFPVRPPAGPGSEEASDTRGRSG